MDCVDQDRGSDVMRGREVNNNNNNTRDLFIPLLLSIPTHLLLHNGTQVHSTIWSR
jgi:hypothetical protein